MRILLATLLLVSSLAGVQAQPYPTRTITLVVPFAAGGPTDTVARVMAESMSKALGQKVVVDNVAGAGGVTGTTRVVRSTPDGYTLLLHHLGLATSVSLYRKLPYDPLKDLAPVAMVSDTITAIIARPGYAPNTLSELIADVRARGNDVTFAHSGLGSSSQLCGLLFMSAIKAKMNEIPYRGGGPVLQALLGNHTDLACEQLTTAASLIKDKRVKAYAVTSVKRVKGIPDVPTAIEAGLPKFEISVWHGIYAPAATPQPVIDVLTKAIAKAMQDPEVISRLAAISTDTTPDKATPEALRKVLADEIARWSPLIKEAGNFAD